MSWSFIDYFLFGYISSHQTNTNYTRGLHVFVKTGFTSSGACSSNRANETRHHYSVCSLVFVWFCSVGGYDVVYYWVLPIQRTIQFGDQEFNRRNNFSTHSPQIKAHCRNCWFRTPGENVSWCRWERSRRRVQGCGKGFVCVCVRDKDALTHWYT